MPLLVILCFGGNAAEISLLSLVVSTWISQQWTVAPYRLQGGNAPDAFVDFGAI